MCDRFMSALPWRGEKGALRVGFWMAGASDEFGHAVINSVSGQRFWNCGPECGMAMQRSMSKHSIAILLNAVCPFRCRSGRTAARSPVACDDQTWP